jgi:tetratricopeptide (TPR) repeat protein
VSDDDKKYDFFISRKGVDSAWAEWIAWILNEAGYRPYLQDWDFLPGHHAIERMQEGATEADRTIALLSPEYLEGGFTQAEWFQRLYDDPTGKERRLIPIKVSDCDPAGFLKPLCRLSLVGKNEAAAKAEIDKLIRSLEKGTLKPDTKPPFPGEQRKQPTRSQPRFPGSVPSTWYVPHRRNRNFTGRETILEELSAALAANHTAAITQAIHGLGGIGKTQLAVEFVYRNRHRYEIVWWIEAEQTATLEAGYRALGSAVGVPGLDGQNAETVRELVRSWLETNGEWLLVFDNARSAEEVREFLPRSAAGHVLITSRSSHWGELANELSLAVLPRDESAALLAKRTERDEPDAAAQLADELGDLPLALVQAAGYIAAAGISIADYLDLYRSHREELWKRESAPGDYPAQQTVATCWNLALEHLPEPSIGLLRLCSFLGPDSIPRMLFEQGRAYLPDPLADALADPLQRNDAVRALRDYSLIEADDTSLSMHRLLQAVVRDQLDMEQEQNWAGAALRLVNELFPFQDKDPGTWEASERLLPHALAAAGHAERLEVIPETAGRLVNECGLFLKLRGQYRGARTLLERAIASDEKAYEPGHPEFAILYSNLAAVERDLGNPKAARTLIERAIEIEQQEYAPDDPKLATHYSNLAMVEQDLGDPEAARTLLERTIEIEEQAYAPDDPALAVSYSNLATVERSLGNLVAARTLLERAVEIEEQAYEPGHPTLAVSYSNLAMVEKDLGNLEAARTLLERARKIWERVYEAEHPTLAVSYSNMAIIERRLGNPKVARGLLERAIEIEEKAYEAGHPTFAVSYSNLATAEVELGNLKEARRLLERAIEIEEKAYEADHPTRAVSYWNLAMVEQDLRNPEEAVTLVRRAHSIRQKKLGEEHPDTKRAARWLAEHDPER